jgi:YbbR domain-containing protein
MMRAPWPFRHAGLKILAVGLAALLWLIVTGEEVVERGLRVPLQFEQLPEDLELVSEPPMLVDVRVRGGASTVSRLSQGDVLAVLDLRTSASGRRLFRLTPEQVQTPPGVEVVQVAPSTVAVAFEKSATGLVAVVPVVDGTPAPGYSIGRITSDPQKVEVVGPESVVRRAREALTETVRVDGARESVTEQVVVGFLTPSLRLRRPQRAKVVVEIVRAEGG